MFCKDSSSDNKEINQIMLAENWKLIKCHACVISIYIMEVISFDYKYLYYIGNIQGTEQILCHTDIVQFVRTIELAPQSPL